MMMINSETKIYFGVRISGKQLSARREPVSNWLNRFVRRNFLQPSHMDGFFTTRFVMALSESEAIAAALNLVQEEMQHLSPESAWRLDADEVWREEE
jgi:hypothetical protein